MSLIPALDFKIFGNGHGFAAPYFNQPFYWLSGEFYTFMHGHGAQLHSAQWKMPRPDEERVICGVKFRPFNVCRSWGRVKIAWATKLPADIDSANEWLRQFARHLQSPNDVFRFHPARDPDGNRDGGDA